LKDALPQERELLEVLLAEPALVPVAAEQLPASLISHPGLRRMLESLYALHAEGEPADLDGLRVRLMDPRAVRVAFDLQFVGRTNPDRAGWLKRILAFFQEQARLTETQRLKTQLTEAADDAQAVELLRRLQNQTVGPDLG
jgi:DNA primase